TESFLLPLTEVAHDVEITRIDFGFDMPQEDALDGGAAENSDHAAAASADPARRARAGAVVLITDAVHSRTGLEAILDEHAGAAAGARPPRTLTACDLVGGARPPAAAQGGGDEHPGLARCRRSQRLSGGHRGLDRRIDHDRGPRFASPRPRQPRR